MEQEAEFCERFAELIDGMSFSRVGADIGISKQTISAYANGTRNPPVWGDSMINARILDGDIVFVRKQSAVNPGEIAVVVIDDEATLKRFRQQGKLAILSPENPAYEPIVVDLENNERVYILGKAIAFQSDVR